MKYNTFVDTDGGGHRAVALQSMEDELIKSIDESRMTPAELRLSRFLEFLGNRKLDVESFKLLSPEEKERLKEEFLKD